MASRHRAGDRDPHRPPLDTARHTSAMARTERSRAFPSALANLCFGDRHGVVTSGTGAELHMAAVERRSALPMGDHEVLAY